MWFLSIVSKFYPHKPNLLQKQKKCKISKPFVANDAEMQMKS